MTEYRNGGKETLRPCGPGQVDATRSSVHASWLQFIRYCSELGYGEIEKLKIQDGLPMTAEFAVKKIKFAP